MVIGDLNIDFKNKNDCDLDKLNNSFGVFSLTNLAGVITVLQKPTNF